MLIVPFQLIDITLNAFVDHVFHLHKGPYQILQGFPL